MAERQTDLRWPVPPELDEPAPPNERRAWGKLPHDERYRRQRRDLIRAAARLATRDGYSGSRVADIVAEAGLSKSTFYEHFTSKDDCFIELHRRTSSAMLRAGIAAAERAVDRGPFEAIVEVIRALLGYVDRDPRLAAVLRTELGGSQPAVQRQRQRNQEYIVELFATLARRLGSSLDDSEIELTSRVLVAGVTSVLGQLGRARDVDVAIAAVARIGCRAWGFDHP